MDQLELDSNALVMEVDAAGDRTGRTAFRDPLTRIDRSSGNQPDEPHSVATEAKYSSTQPSRVAVSSVSYSASI